MFSAFVPPDYVRFIAGLLIVGGAPGLAMPSSSRLDAVHSSRLFIALRRRYCDQLVHKGTRSLPEVNPRFDRRRSDRDSRV